MYEQSLIRGSAFTSHPDASYSGKSLPFGFRRVRAAVPVIVEATANKSLAIIISKTSQGVGTAERTMRAPVGSAVGALNRADGETIV